MLNSTFSVKADIIEEPNLDSMNYTVFINCFKRTENRFYTTKYTAWNNSSQYDRFYWESICYNTFTSCSSIQHTLPLKSILPLGSVWSKSTLNTGGVSGQVGPSKKNFNFYCG